MRGENCPSIDVVGVLKVQSSFAPKKRIALRQFIHPFIYVQRERETFRRKESEKVRQRERENEH